MNINRNVLFGILIVVLLLGALWRLHYREIERGEFRGFTIGMTKTAAYHKIREEGVTAIWADQVDPFMVRAASDFSAVDLESYEGVVIVGKGL